MEVEIPNFKRLADKLLAERLERAIELLVLHGKAERIRMPDGKPGVRLVKEKN